MSVEEFATHISSSLPAGKSRVRPGRFIVSTSHCRLLLVVLAAHIVSSSAGCETFAVSELATANPLWIATWATNARAGIEQMPAEPFCCAAHLHDGSLYLQRSRCWRNQPTAAPHEILNSERYGSKCPPGIRTSFLGSSACS